MQMYTLISRLIYDLWFSGLPIPLGLLSFRPHRTRYVFCFGDFAMRRSVWTVR